MQWNVHVKNEFGRDDNIAVEAESEIAAERAAAQHGSVAVVMGAYPADAASPPLVEATATGEFSQIADEFDAVAASARAARTDADRTAMAQQWEAVMSRARAALDDVDAVDDNATGDAESYHGPYASNADQVMQAELSRSLGVRFEPEGWSTNTRAEVARAREALAQLRDQQANRPDPGRALTADDWLDARGR